MKSYDLTKGSIFKNIILVSIPLILGNFISMLYNFTDIFWISKIGPAGVSAVGTTSLFIWLGASYISLATLGGRIKVSHAVGKKDMDAAAQVSYKSLRLGLLLSILYGFILFTFNEQIIGFFNLSDPTTLAWAQEFLKITGVTMIFMLLNHVYSAIYNGMGNTPLVLKIMAIGVVVNMILDPLFIITFDLKVAGAAYATLLGSVVTFLIFTYHTYKHTQIFKQMRIKSDFKLDLEIIKLGFTPMIQNMTFTFISIFITRFIATFGDEAIAIQKVGNEIESLTWMVGVGISTAISVFVGQNYAAHQYDRIKKGSRIMTALLSGYGLIITLIFIFYGANLYSIFFAEPELIGLGQDYLYIIGFSQLFMIYEAIFTGIFNGYGKINVPAFFGISGNLMRIPLIVLFTPAFGLNGIWIAITISSIYKGVGMIFSYATLVYKQHRMRLFDEQVEIVQ